MPYKNIEDLRKYQREWLQRKKRGETTRLYPIPTREEKELKVLEKNRRYKKKLTDKKKEINVGVFSPGCFICRRSDVKIVRHRKDGKRHDDFTSMPIKKYVKEVNSGNYVLLCSYCHSMVHWNMTQLNFGWKEISRRLGEKFINTKRGITQHEAKI